MAVLEAQQWCDKPENKDEMCQIISQDKWLKVPVADIIAAQIPATTSRGIETFFDGVKFDPDKPEEYLKSLAIKKA